MLSAPTLEILEALCAESHEAYPEGGTLWTYTEGANQAHAHFRETSQTIASGALDPDALGRWLQWAVGDRDATKPESVERAKALLATLQRDLSPDEWLWSLEDNGTDMRGVLRMARRTDNRYFSLELLWSED